MTRSSERLALAIAISCLLAPDAPAQVGMRPLPADGGFQAGVETALEGIKAPIVAQKVLARKATPVSEAIELVKDDLRRTSKKFPNYVVVPDAYVDEIFDGRHQMLYPEIPKKYADRKKLRDRFAGLRNNAPSAKAPSSYDAYRKQFITEKNIEKGVAFARSHSALLNAVHARYRVDGALLVALVSRETRYGADVGSYRVFDALYTIILNVPEAKWIKFAVHEEAEFIRMVYAQKMSVYAAHAVLGTYDGGMGYVQFEPSSFNAYAVDFDGDGKTRLNEWPDALGSAANYLSKRGYDPSAKFTPDSPIGRSLFAYNPSDNYVRAILEMRNEIQKRLSKKKIAPR